MNKYTNPVKIRLDDQTYNWSPESGLLADEDDIKATANEQVLRLLLADLAEQYGGRFPVTPEGPYLETSTFDIYTVVFLIETTFSGSEITYSDEVPTLSEMGIRGGLPNNLDGVN